MGPISSLDSKNYNMLHYFVIAMEIPQPDGKKVWRIEKWSCNHYG